MKRIALFLPFILLYSCNEADPIDVGEVSEIYVADIANNGDGSDVEVNFLKQDNESAIREYRILVIKSGSISALDLKSALEITDYTAVEPSEVILARGTYLNSDSKDSDGELITEGLEYQVGILSIVKDRDQFIHSLTIGAGNFSLGTNNLVRNFTPEYDAGSGALSMDPEGNLFMSNYDVHSHFAETNLEEYSLLKINSSGSIIPFSGPYPLAGGIDFDSQGNLWQSHFLDGDVVMIDSEGVTTPVDKGFYPINNPDGIYVDELDNVFVADQQSGHIIRITPTGELEEYAQVGFNPRGIIGDGNGNLYISHNHESGRISKIDSNGEVSLLANVPTKRPENYPLEFLMWVGYIELFENELYVAGLSTHQIYKVSLEGEVDVFVGSGNKGIPYGGASTADLNRPMGLKFKEDGSRLYISGCTDITPSHTQYTRPMRIWEVQIVE